MRSLVRQSSRGTSFPALFRRLWFQVLISETQSWRKRNMTHQCSHERAPASDHASAHASVHESAHKSWLLCIIIPYKAGWTFRIFFIFFCSGEGKGESEALGGGGGRFFIENLRRGGGVLPAGRGGGGPGGCLRGIRGGGAKYFFSGPKFPPSKAPTRVLTWVLTRVPTQVYTKWFGRMSLGLFSLALFLTHLMPVRTQVPWPRACATHIDATCGEVQPVLQLSQQRLFLGQSCRSSLWRHIRGPRTSSNFSPHRIRITS